MKFGKHFALILAVLALGCTSGGVGGGFSQTAGAEINDFSLDVANVEDFGDMAVLTFSFQNVGGKTMEGNTEAFVYNIPLTDKSHESTTKEDELRKWYVQDTGGGTLDTAKQRIKWVLTASQFYPPDTDNGQPGMSQTYRIVTIPPKQDEGMENIQYTFEGMLCYPYKTTTSSIIRSIAQNTFASVASKKSLAETKNSAGPIQISLKAGENIRANTGGGNTSLPLVFEVKDVGGGFSTDKTVECNPLVEKSKIGVLSVNVFIDGTEVDCNGGATGTAGTVYVRNGVGNLFCTGTFPNQNPKSEYHIVAQAKYNYYLTKSATISVSDSKDTADKDTA